MSARYVRDGSLDLTFDFGFGERAIISLHSGDAGSIRASLQEIADAYPPDTLATFLTNHDQNRVIDRARRGRRCRPARGDAAADRPRHAVRLLRRGDRDDRPEARRADPDADALGRVGAGGRLLDRRRRGSRSATTRRGQRRDQAADPASLLSAYRDSSAFGRRIRPSRPGDVLPVDADAPSVVAYLRIARTRRRSSSPTSATSPSTSPVLTSTSGPLCGAPSARVVHGAGEASRSGRRARPAASIDYVPLARLGPREAVVIELGRMTGHPTADRPESSGDWPRIEPTTSRATVAVAAVRRRARGGAAHRDRAIVQLVAGSAHRASPPGTEAARPLPSRSTSRRSWPGSLVRPRPAVAPRRQLRRRARVSRPARGPRRARSALMLGLVDVVRPVSCCSSNRPWFDAMRERTRRGSTVRGVTDPPAVTP